MSREEEVGPMSGSNSNDPPRLHLVRPVRIPAALEYAIGSMVMMSSLPAVMKIRLLGHATAPENHAGILERGLMANVEKGLTPAKEKFIEDASKKRRIFVGGFSSSVVYSNMTEQDRLNPRTIWLKAAMERPSKCAFLFWPTQSVLRYPVVAMVPEHIFMKNFMKDEFSIVKVASKTNWIFPSVIPIPGAYKSVPDFRLLPQYFIGSPQFDMRKILQESAMGTLTNPWRFFRGCAWFSVGAAMVCHAMSGENHEK
jgi:hypothetical protein